MSNQTPPAVEAYSKRLTKFEVNIDETGTPISSRFSWCETFRRPDGSVASEVHTPEYLDDHNGDRAKLAIGDLAAAQALQIAAHSATIATQTAELAAKDASAQELLGKMDEQRMALEAMTADRDRLRIVVDTFPVETAPVDPAA